MKDVVGLPSLPYRDGHKWATPALELPMRPRDCIEIL